MDNNIVIPEKNTELRKTKSKEILLQCIMYNKGEITEYGCAESIYELCKSEFIYYDIWYKLVDHTKWIAIKKGIELRKRIPLLKQFIDEEMIEIRPRIKVLEKELSELEENEDENKDTIIRVKTSIKNLDKKRTYLMNARKIVDKTGFKNNVMVECRDLFFDTEGIITTFMNNISKLQSNNNVVVQNTNDSTINHIELISTQELLVSSTNEQLLVSNPSDIFIEISVNNKLNEINWKNSNKYKRVVTIVHDFDFKKTILISKKIKEYFIKNGVKVVEDKVHGHKIYIEY